MGSLELGEINLEELLEIGKRREVRLEELTTGMTKTDESIFSKDNMAAHSHDIKVKTRRRQKYDIQNIGAGTRCLECGLLHFCWTPACAGCGGAMDYNLGKYEQ